MKKLQFSLLLSLILMVSDLSAETIKGYVANGYTTPVSGAEVFLLDSEGNVVKSDVTGWTGGYKFKGIDPGFYILQVADFAVVVELKQKNLRQDFDLTRPGGAFSYGERAVEQAVQLLQQQALSSSRRGGSRSPDGSYPGSADYPGNVCYEGTCEKNGDTTTVYDDGGAVIDQY
jgi:hypothetical protein